MQKVNRIVTVFYCPCYRSVEVLSLFLFHVLLSRVSKGAKIRNRYNHVPHLAQDTNGKVTNSQLYTTNGSQEVSPFQAGDHRAQINRRAQKHNKHKTEKIYKIHKRSTALERSVKYFTGGLILILQRSILDYSLVDSGLFLPMS